MPFGPLGDVADTAGPTTAEGIKSGQYTCFEVCQPEDGILEVVLNRPKAMNAMSARFVRELHQILDVLQYPVTRTEQIKDVRVLILRGEGAAFCAGYDLKD